MPSPTRFFSLCQVPHPKGTEGLRLSARAEATTTSMPIAVLGAGSLGAADPGEDGEEEDDEEEEETAGMSREAVLGAVDRASVAS